ncbi:Holliday junction resolvase RuvX [bacterium]|nr:Holliday junction resolvase RuvX [bacterium]
MPVLIGLDYGVRRIGIAISDTGGRLALPVGVHVEGRDGSVIARLDELARSRGATGVVVGLPLRTDGGEGDIAARARRFAGRLGEELGLPVTLIDERYSSRSAEQAIAARGRPARRGEVDDVAAQIILQDHLDRLQAGADTEGDA